MIDTVPPDAIVELKFSEPDPTAASPSMMTVDGAPDAVVLNLNDAGVPDARPVADVIADAVKTPAAAPGANGFEHASDASFVPGSALKTPAVLPAGAPVKISRKPAVPSADVSEFRRALRVASW